MTELAFHFGAPDKLSYACRLVRKAAGSGANVVVMGDDEAIAKLDMDLWNISATDFVPHCVSTSAASVRRHSSVLLTASMDQASGPFGVLVNLADTVPQGFERFQRLIEVVSTDPADRDLARGRWRHYTELGHTIQRHDLSLKRAV